MGAHSKALDRDGFVRLLEALEDERPEISTLLREIRQVFPP